LHMLMSFARNSCFTFSKIADLRLVLYSNRRAACQCQPFRVGGP
jgi:hypothetical protein